MQKLFDTPSIANQGSFIITQKSETVLSHSVTCIDNTKQAIDQFAEANVDLLAKFVKPISIAWCLAVRYATEPAWGSSS